MPECPTCGREDFKSDRGMKHHHARVHNESLSVKEYSCSQCNQIFEKRASETTDSDRNFCSTDCMSDWMEENAQGEDSPAWQGGSKIELECSICGELFKREQSNTTKSDNNFCSTTCFGKWIEQKPKEEHARWKGGDIEIDCHECGETITRRRSRVETAERIFCSVNCQGEWRSRNRTGDDAFNWRGGHTKYYGPTWHGQRRKAIDRDDEKCVDCGMTRDEHHDKFGADLEVHHKTPIRTFSDTEEANQLSNLVTVCTNCHQKREHS